MALTTLLLQLAADTTDDALIGTAARLAARHRAHLIGMHATTPIELYATPEMALPAEVARSIEANRSALDKRLATAFGDACEKAGDCVAEWRRLPLVLRSVEQTVAELGDATDLLMLARPAEPDAREAGDLAVRVLARSARPVMLVPGDQTREVGERVLVAWDGSRESTRAVFGALPLLTEAAEVRLHRINQHWQDRHHVVGMTEALASTLARHGVALEVQHSDAKAGEIGEEILGFARDMQADLVVTGCYGHGRFREFLFGGTTRHLLREARVPLLMQS